VCSIRVFAKNLGDPYYEPTIMVHDNACNHTQHTGDTFLHLLQSISLFITDSK